MQISVKDAQQNLAELLDRAENGEEVLLTREGRVVARIVATDMASRPVLAPEARPTLRDIQARVRQKLDPFAETSAARSQDFLYDENGLPR